MTGRSTKQAYHLPLGPATLTCYVNHHCHFASILRQGILLACHVLNSLHTGVMLLAVFWEAAQQYTASQHQQLTMAYRPLA